MDKNKKLYFQEIQTHLEEYCKKAGQKEKTTECSLPLMPLQYKYIHNLKTGKFEDVEGVDTILGYDNQKFTLDFYYGILHPEDLEVTFGMSKEGTDFVEQQKRIYPLSVQLNVMQRVLRKNGEYAHIFRQSTIYQTIGNRILKTLSICTDVSALGLKWITPVQLHIVDSKQFNTGKIIYDKKAKIVDQLTAREKEIAFWALEGLTSEEIAARLLISRHTVDTHRRKILKKTGVKSMVELRNYTNDLLFSKP